MKEVIIQKKPTGWGWYMPKGDVVCNCIYAKLTDRNIYDDDLDECIRETYPINYTMQRRTRRMIERIDRNIGTANDIKSLCRLANKLEMAVATQI